MFAHVGLFVSLFGCLLSFAVSLLCSFFVQIQVGVLDLDFP